MCRREKEIKKVPNTIHGVQEDGMKGRKNGFLKGPAYGGLLLLACISGFGCAGPFTVTEYEDGMETGQETVVYDDNGHPEITSETGYVVDPYAESYSIEKEDFRPHGAGVVPD
jgi:hypothetical protein